MDAYGTIGREQDWLDAVTTRLQLLEAHVRGLERTGVELASEWNATADLLDANAELVAEIALLRPLREHLESRIARLREALD